jgi:RNA polymerase-binding transcription factor DksA
MATKKPGTDKGGKKSVTASSKAGKTAPKKAAPAAKKAAVKQAPVSKTKIKKPAGKVTAAPPPAKAPAKTSKPVAAVKKKVGKAAPPPAVVKTIKKPSAPVKEKASEKVSAPVTPEAPAKKKKAEVKPEEAPVVAAAKPAAKKTETAKTVKIPKISATAAVPYEPDFTHSVLDTVKDEPVQPGAPTLRYSDGELVEFKNLIQRKLDAAKKELAYLQGLITRKDEMGGDNDDGRYMTMEDGSLSMEREQLSQMASRQITFIDHLEKALMRIENKTYGICRVTGKLIEKARLRAVPHATLSMEAKTSKTRVG